MNGVGVVAALEAEAHTLGPQLKGRDGLATLGDGALLAVSGMGGARAAMAARRLIDAGASSLMSFGMAGGLDPTLNAGQVLLPSEVISREGARFAVTAQWHERLSLGLVRLRPVVDGKLLSCDAAIESVADKAAAFRETGAMAVDMESLSIAHVADAHRLAFIAVRVIVDTAADALPRAVLAASRGGSLSMLRLITGLIAAPLDLVALLRLSRRYRAARQSLAAVARARVA